MWVLSETVERPDDSPRRIYFHQGRSLIVFLKSDGSPDGFELSVQTDSEHFNDTGKPYLKYLDDGSYHYLYITEKWLYGVPHEMPKDEFDRLGELAKFRQDSARMDPGTRQYIIDALETLGKRSPEPENADDLEKTGDMEANLETLISGKGYFRTNCPQCGARQMMKPATKARCAQCHCLFRIDKLGKTSVAQKRWWEFLK